VVVVNGAEGEPSSWKDRVLMAGRPHLVLDGAFIAAESVGASEVVVYFDRTFVDAQAGLERALEERRANRGYEGIRLPVRLVGAPSRYVAGEETAVVRFVSGGPAKPTLIPPRPFERGVKGRPTLMQNVETLCLVALIARFGPAWFRSLGSPTAPGPLLVSISGSVSRPGVYEVPHGSRLFDALELAGATNWSALLLGGYFGTWVPARDARSLPLDHGFLESRGVRLGCGAIFALSADACGLMETTRILTYLAGESAGQCGPCMYGLASLAELVSRVASGNCRERDGDQLQRWIGQLGLGRGACKHPDGAVGMLTSALRVFSADLDRHLRRGACMEARTHPAPPALPHYEGWR
jgi:NADH:ubiquinone oxidoreductase subunit F (NADH-binding)